LKFRATSQ